MATTTQHLQRPARPLRVIMIGPDPAELAHVRHASEYRHALRMVRRGMRRIAVLRRQAERDRDR